MTKDVFTMSRIITKANIKEELYRIVTDSDNTNKLSLGIDFALSIMAGISEEKTEKEIYKFLASVLECSEQDIEESDPMILIDRLTQDEGHEQWADFFSKVLKLTKKEI
jgi:hypothetical protein